MVESDHSCLKELPFVSVNIKKKKSPKLPHNIKLCKVMLSKYLLYDNFPESYAFMGMKLNVAVTWKHAKNVGKREYIHPVLLGPKDSDLNQHFIWFLFPHVTSIEGEHILLYSLAVGTPEYTRVMELAGSWAGLFILLKSAFWLRIYWWKKCQPQNYTSSAINAREWNQQSL